MNSIHKTSVKIIATCTLYNVYKDLDYFNIYLVVGTWLGTKKFLNKFPNDGT